MKKFLLLICSVAVWMTACDNDIQDPGTNPPVITKGTLVVMPEVTEVLEITRAVDLSSFTVILTGAESRTVTLPEDGKITNLTTGDYTVNVVSDADGMQTEFGEPYYSGTATATVRENIETNVTVECIQRNAGVYFTYDAALGNEFGEVVPVITRGSNSLTYIGTNKNATGYFEPGAATLRIVDTDETTIQIAGSNSYPITLSESQLVRIHIRPSESTWDDGVALDITSIDVNDPTDKDSWTVEPTVEVETLVFTEASGYYWGDFIADDTDNYSLYMYTEGIEEEGSVSGTGIALILDLYAPYQGNSDLIPSVYEVGEIDVNEYRILAGEEGEGTFTGSAIYKSEDGDEKEYFYIESGTMTVATSTAGFTITGRFTDTEGNNYETSYDGATNMINLVELLSGAQNHIYSKQGKFLVK